MIRIVLYVFILLVFFQAPRAHAQDNILTLEQTIDSLRVTRADLTRHLNSIDKELERLESRLQEHFVRELSGARGVLVTNMDASLRDEPMPGATVIRTIPQNTIVEALEYNGAYWKVRYENAEGWVMRMFVNEGEGADELKKDSESGDALMKELATARQGWEKERNGKSFLIKDFDLHTNTAGGISIQYSFEHLDSTRTIREVIFSITPYNSEGVIERGKNSGVSTRRLRRFGPVSVYDGEQRFQFENVWYNENIECAELNRIDIAYSDGTRSSYSKDIDTILASDILNSCKITAAASIDPTKRTDPE